MSKLKLKKPIERITDGELEPVDQPVVQDDQPETALDKVVRVTGQGSKPQS